MLGEDWQTLYTYEAVLDELDGKQPEGDGYQALLGQVQKFGG